MKKPCKVSVYAWIVIAAVSTLLSSDGRSFGNVSHYRTRSGLVVYVDPRTGEIIDRPATQNPLSNLSARSAMDDNPAAEPLAAGGFKVDTTSLALSYVIATVDDQGEVHGDCVPMYPIVDSDDGTGAFTR